MSATTVPPGWHPDPTLPAGTLRWWDGSQWTEHIRPAAPVAPPQPPAPMPATVNVATSAPSAVPQQASASAAGLVSHPVSSSEPAQQSIFQRNPTTFMTLAISAVYIFIATTTGFVLIGFVPIALSIRALQRGEQLAPLAMLSAAAVVVIGLSIITHH